MLLDGNEVIHFRTHSVVLTEKRLIVDGSTYRLDRVTDVRPVRASYYLPLIALRILTLVAAAGVLFWFFTNTDGDLISLRNFILLIIAAALGGGLFLLMGIVPTHVLRLESTRGNANVLGSSDKHFLQDVADKINEMRANLPT